MCRRAAAATALAAQQDQSPTSDHPHDGSTATDHFVFVDLSFFDLLAFVPILRIDSAPKQCRANLGGGEGASDERLSAAESRL